MKGDVVPEEVVPHFMGAFEALVSSNFSPEVMRSLSLFITYAFHTRPVSLPRTPRPASNSRSSTPGFTKRPTGEFMATGSPATAQRFLTKKQLGIKVLNLYSRLLCVKNSSTQVKKFARTVTNKVGTRKGVKKVDTNWLQWLLYLLAADDAEIVVHGCRILARLLVIHGHAYTAKFAGKGGGFSIMANRLRRFWDIPTLWPICFSILFGYDIAEIDFDREFDMPGLLDLFGKQKIVYPESLVIITSMLQNGLKDVMRHEDDPDSPANKATADNKMKSSMSVDDIPGARSMDLAKALERRRMCDPAGFLRVC